MAKGGIVLNLFSGIIKTMSGKKSFIAKVYLYSLLNNLVLIYSLYSITFQQKGLSVAQIGIALMFWSVSVILLQIPIGILSDRISRRNMLVFGNVVVALAFFIFMAWPSFVGVMTGFGLWGIKWAIDAACFQPMVYDHIRDKKKYLAIVGTCKSINLVGLALSALCSFLVFLGYDFLTWCTIGLMGLGAVVLLSMPRDTHVMRRRDDKRIGLRDIGIAARFVCGRPALMGAMAVLVILNMGLNIDEWLGLIALQLGYPEYAVGALYFIALICGALGGLVVRGIRQAHVMLVPTLIAGGGVMLILATIWFNVWSTLALCAFWVLLIISESVTYTDFQNRVATNIRGRATALLEIMLNVGSMGAYGIMTVTHALGGGYQYGLGIIGVILMLTALGTGWANWKKDGEI